MDDWEPLEAEIPEYIEKDGLGLIPGSIISIDLADTAFKITPHYSGYNQPVHAGGSFYNQPELLRHIRNVKPQIIRYPGGTAAMSFFWNRTLQQGPPDDVHTYMRWGEVMNNFRYGMSEYSIFSLNSFYNLMDSLENARSIIVVNYGYARYGLSDNPVQKAAKLAADWVRYDNGRTKFWEVGNELNGIWTPGHQIDVSKNKDGQPEFITGALYAQHFQIFVDSMQAAALEIGSDIKIGAVLAHREGTWNRDFLENAGDVADFVIIHNYYGKSGVTDPYHIINTAEDLKIIKEETDADLDNYAQTRVPITLTEWNTNDDTQGGLCVNGMSGIFATKNILEAQYGLACRHTLLQSNPRGLINMNASVTEGLAFGQPRAPYFYFYYLRRFLGDLYHDADIGNTENMDVLASSFSSGHAGVIVLNKSPEPRTTALSLKNFVAGSRYYFYILSPENDNPLSKKVLVNSQSNGSIAGGPLEYETVKAFSRTTDGAVLLELPPFSVGYIMIEGQMSAPEANRDVQFTIYGQIADSVFLLNEAFVSLNSLCEFTDNQGEIHFDVREGLLNYQIHKNGFQSKISQLEISENVHVRDTLQIGKNEVSFIFRDLKSGMPLEDLSIVFDGRQKQTTSDGGVLFTDTPVGNHPLEVLSPEFAFSEVIDISSDTSIVFFISERTYQINIEIKDEQNNMPLSGVLIFTNELSIETGVNGNALLELGLGNHDLQVSKAGYENKNISFSVSRDTAITLTLIPFSADLKFRIYEGTTPINNVEISISDVSKLTNALGMATFSGLNVGVKYFYTISKNGFIDIDSSIVLLTNTTVDIQMQKLTGIFYYQQEAFSFYPNPAYDKLYIESDISILHLELLHISGKVVFSGKSYTTNKNSVDVSGLPKGVYVIKITAGNKEVYRRLIFIK